MVFKNLYKFYSIKDESTPINVKDFRFSSSSTIIPLTLYLCSIDPSMVDEVNKFLLDEENLDHAHPLAPLAFTIY